MSLFFLVLNMTNRVAHRGILCACLLVTASMTVEAQFKEIPPAPYTPGVARQKIRTLIENAGPDNRQQTADRLSSLLVWYRDLVDDELIAAWKGDERANLPALMTLLADSRVASAIVEFSWHQQRSATFNLTYAPMLGDLMARYHGSADPFVHDLLGPAVAGGQMPDLSQPEAQAVCRILLDMPDTGNWKKTALLILPHYRLSAQDLLVQDLRGNNQEKIYRAQFWLADLKLNVPGITSDPRQQGSRSMPPPSPAGGRAPIGNQTPSDAISQRPHIVEQPSVSLKSGDFDDAPARPFSAAPFPLPYGGPRSGTLKCSGDHPVPPDAEYVFPGMPLGNLQIDLDGKPWDARLVPGKGQTQDLILKNKGFSPQKRCTVHWIIVP
jgi:hypothetical protein